MMPSPSTALEGHSLLGVFAHPDDESLACGGLLAWCATWGATVSLLCATRGEHGPGRTSGDLGTTRQAELQAASRALGIREVEVLDYEDGMLPWADHERLEGDIHDALRRHRPDVVITFGEDGLYWHPDHVAIHHRVTSVITTLGGMAPALYYVSIPSGRMRAVVNYAASVAGDETPPPRCIFGIAEVDAFGDSASPPTLEIETGPYAVRKLEALRCHASQLQDCALAYVSASNAADLIGLEHYRQASVGSQRPAFIERLATAAPS